MRFSFLNVRIRKVLRDLLSDKVRTSLVVLAIAVGVFSISTISRARTIFGENIVEAYLAINPAHAYISVDSLDDDLVERVNQIDGVDTAEGRRIIWTRLRNGDQDWKTVKITAVSEFEAINVNQIPAQEAEWPVPDDTIVLERTAFAPLDVQLGETLTVESITGQERLMPVTNSVHDLNSFPSTLGDGIVFGYTTLDTAAWLGVAPTNNQLWITVDDENYDLATIHQVSDAVEAQLERAGVQVLGTEIPIPNQHQFQPSVGSILFVMNVLAWVALLMSCLLIVNTISAILKQQTRQIGIMKTIGAPQRDILGMYTGMIFAYSILALFIALPLGIISARLGSQLMANIINFDIQSYEVPLYVLLLELSAALIVPVIVGLFPILNAMRVTVREATSDADVSQFGDGFIDKLLSKLPGLSATVLYAMRNIFRRKGRLALTLSTLAIGGGVFIAILGLNASLDYTLANDTSDYWQQDVTVRFLTPYRINRVNGIAAQVSGVEYTEGWSTKSSYRTNVAESQSQQSLSIFAVPPDSQFLEPTLVNGRWLQEDDTNAIVLNVQTVAIWPDLNVGDEIPLNLEGEEENWQIVGIVTSQLIGGGGESKASPPPIAYANYDYVSKLLGESNLVNRLLVKTSQQTSLFQDLAADALEEQFTEQNIKLTGVDTRNLIFENARSAMVLLTSSLLLLAMLFCIVGGLSLTSTMSLNVLERTREIGVIRAIGADDSITRQIILYEGFFVGLISWILASILGFGLSLLFGYFVGLSLLQYPIPPYFSVISIFLWLLIALTISAIASYLPARHASRLSVRKVLSYE